MALPALCRAPDRSEHDVVISDLTAEGCGICTMGLELEVGHRVTVRPEALEHLAGQVRWSSGTKAGIEFERPIYVPVAEYLQREYAIFR